MFIKTFSLIILTLKTFKISSKDGLSIIYHLNHHINPNLKYF